MKALCSKCKREFEAKEPELEYNELDPSGRGWIEEKEDLCSDCLEDGDLLD